jgi:hypothetical protein
MKRYNGENGSAVEMDAEEAANASVKTAPKAPLKEMGDAGAAEEAGQFGDAGSSRTVKATPKAAPKPKAAAKSESAPAAKATPVDKTKLSLTERAKLSRESARSGSGATDTRSVSQRIRSAFGMKNGGATKMASGGMTSSASKRADGVAVKGKTRGKMC